MHELALCSAIANTVVEHAAGRAVHKVRIRIGAYRQVVPDTLAFCWEVHTAGTELEGCRLTLITVPAVVACRTCGEHSTLDSPILLCGSCDGADVRLVAGEEFLIESIDIERTATAEEVS